MFFAALMASIAMTFMGIGGCVQESARFVEENPGSSVWDVIEHIEELP